MGTTEPSDTMIFAIVDDDDICQDCGEDRFSLCSCPDDRDDFSDPERHGHPPDEHTEMLDGAIYLAEQARDVRAMRGLIAQRDGKALHEVWIHLVPPHTRKHRLRSKRCRIAKKRRALERGRRAAHSAGLDVRAVELVYALTCPRDITAMCHCFVVWTDGGLRVDQVVEGCATTGDDLPW